MKSKHRGLVVISNFQITFLLNLVVVVSFIVLKIIIRNITNLKMRRNYLTYLRDITNLNVTYNIWMMWINHTYLIIVLIFA